MSTKKRVSEPTPGDVVELHGVPVLLSASGRCPACAPNSLLGEAARKGYHREHNYASVAYAKEVIGGVEGPDGYVLVSDTLGR